MIDPTPDQHAILKARFSRFLALLKGLFGLYAGEKGAAEADMAAYLR
jgi:hypothetical protein